MIIRAVSDDEDDDDQQQRLSGSVFGSGPSASPSNVSTLRLHSARLAWVGATLALVVLLLVDLAAIMSHFQRQLTDDPTTFTRDPFALVPVLLDAWAISGIGLSSVLGGVFAAPATAVNNLLGFIGVAAWIVSRETSAQVTRSRRAAAAATTNIWTAGSPWTLVVGILCFGHVVSCGYVLLALFESNGDRSRFFLGKASANSRTYPRV
ncbi:hypothetical protein Gpo141_00009379 [Globisporangium polare]